MDKISEKLKLGSKGNCGIHLNKILTCDKVVSESIYYGLLPQGISIKIEYNPN